MKKIIVVNGPNINLLGTRQPEIYGYLTLEDINKNLKEMADKFDNHIEFYQSNHEGKLIDYIHSNKDADYMIANFGAYTHTSIAIRDAILAVGLKFIEVHLTEPNNREPFRRFSYFTDIAENTISGFKDESYYKALKTINGL
jgi:3-dehydroquinate dehydratase-2